MTDVDVLFQRGMVCAVATRQRVLPALFFYFFLQSASESGSCCPRFCFHEETKVFR